MGTFGWLVLAAGVAAGVWLRYYLPRRIRDRRADPDRPPPSHPGGTVGGGEENR